jgi:transposase
LDHQTGEADAFYRNLQEPVRVGIETTGPIRWFERLLAELGHELWIGDAAKIRASEVREQKTDERDARLILDLLAGGAPLHATQTRALRFCGRRILRFLKDACDNSCK